MSIPQKTWQQVESRVRHRIASSKLRHARFNKLVGAEAKTAVIESAVARLMAPDAVLPNALRMRLKPRPRQLVGNLWLPGRPIDPTLWAAWLAVHRSYVERGSFWFEKNEGADNLIDLAIDAERDLYCSATADSGDIDPELLARFSEAGQAWSATPELEREKERHLEAYNAARERRKQEAEEEFAKLKPLLNEYADKLTLQQRHAWHLIVNEPELTGKAISDASGASTGKVSQLRSWFGEMTAKFFSLCEPSPEESVAVDAVPTAAADETETQIAGASEVEAVALDWMASVRAPDTDADVSENVMRGYARSQRSSSALQRPTRRQYSDSALMKGSERHRATSEDQVFEAHKQQLRDFKDRPISEAATAAIKELAARFGLDEEALLKSAALRMSLDQLLGAAIRGKR